MCIIRGDNDAKSSASDSIGLDHLFTTLAVHVDVFPGILADKGEFIGLCSDYRAISCMKSLTIL